MKVRELRAIFVKMEGKPFNLVVDELDIVIILPNGGEWTVDRMTPAIGSDNEPVFAIVPRED